MLPPALGVEGDLWGSFALTSLELHPPEQRCEGNRGWSHSCHWRGEYLGTAVFWDFLFCTSHAVGAAQGAEVLCSFSWRGVQASLGDPKCECVGVWAVSSAKVHCYSVFILCKLSCPCISAGIMSGGMGTAGTS